MIWNMLLFGILMLRRVDGILSYLSSIGIIWIGKFLPGMVSCSDVEVVLPPRVVLRFLPWGVTPTKGRFSHSHGTEAFARMALRKSGAEDLLQATRPWQLFFKCSLLSFLIFFAFWAADLRNSAWSWPLGMERCCLWLPGALTVMSGRDSRNWIEWFLLVFGIYSARTLCLCLLSSRLSLDHPCFWIQVAAVLELLTCAIVWGFVWWCLIHSSASSDELERGLGCCLDGFMGKRGCLMLPPFLCHRSSQHWQRRRVHPVWTLDVSGQEDKTGRGQKLAAQLRIASTAINRQQAVWNFSANCKTGSL